MTHLRLRHGKNWVFYGEGGGVKRIKQGDRQRQIDLYWQTSRQQ